jgi:signal transduction histidine kinase
VEEASEHDIALVTDVEPGVPIVKADSTWLAQAVGNLVSNAIKYTPPGGQINIRADHDARSVSIAVQDTGPGIPPDEQEAIFTAFHRGTAADTGPRGMGLGLSITRDLVHAHGGKIDLKSAPGEGSEFTIRLPLDGTPLT